MSIKVVVNQTINIITLDEDDEDDRVETCEDGDELCECPLSCSTSEVVECLWPFRESIWVRTWTH